MAEEQVLVEELAPAGELVMAEDFIMNTGDANVASGLSIFSGGQGDDVRRGRLRSKIKG